MRTFKKETETVEIPFDEYLELLWGKKKYNHAVRALQAIGREDYDYSSSKQARAALELLDEEVLLPEIKRAQV